MSWDRDSLLAKARLFFERAFDLPREDPQFGLWCAFGLELLARATLASVSPTLLAEPDNDHKHLLHSLGHGAERSSGKSIGSAKVFALCKTLFGEFREEDRALCTALLNRRNDELHSGGAPFDEYPTGVWIAGFYRSCIALGTVLDESIESILGEDEADIAKKSLSDNENDTKQRVLSSIAAHRKVFEGKSADERAEAQKIAEENGEKLSHLRHHRATCPSCKCTGLLQGETFGKEHISHDEGEIIIKQSVAPTAFACTACELNLNGYSELAAAGLSNHYTRTTIYSPEDYYGLVDPDSIDVGDLAMRWLSDYGPEYDNE